MNQMLDLVIQVSRSVIQTEVKTNPQVILNTLKEAVEALPQVERTVSIYLHPHDLAVVQSAYGVAALADRDWRLIDDPSLNIGDIQVACVDSRIDYRMEDRIAQCFQRFLTQNTPLARASDPASSVLLDAEKLIPPSSLPEDSPDQENDVDGTGRSTTRQCCGQ